MRICIIILTLVLALYSSGFGVIYILQCLMGMADDTVEELRKGVIFLIVSCYLWIVLYYLFI